MLKKTLKAIMNSRVAVQKLIQLELDAKQSYKVLLWLETTMDPIFSVIDKKQITLMKKYGTVDGQMLKIEPGDTNFLPFSSQWDPFLATVEEIDPLPLEFDELMEGILANDGNKVSTHHLSIIRTFCEGYQEPEREEPPEPDSNGDSTENTH